MYKPAHARRNAEILSTFTRYGFGYLLGKLGLKGKGRASKASTAEGLEEQLAHNPGTKGSSGKRFRLALEELGPTFIKIGQILSTRADLLPPDILNELKLLQDSVHPFPFEEARAVIEAEFKEKLENVYKEFDPKPVAAASISQVHRAWLFSGKEVAVKVQRPGIESQIRIDLEILKNLAGLINRHTRLGLYYDFSGMVAEFEKTLLNELDFTKEGKNADTFRQNLAWDEGITVPDIKWLYTTKRVLTMEYMRGVSVKDLTTLDKWGLDKNKLGERISASIINQILRDGFFHADPHPGNVRILEDGTIIFLDLGMVGRLSDRKKEMITHFFIGFATMDANLVVESILDLDAMPDKSRLPAFERDVNRLMEKYMTMPMNEIKAESLFTDVFTLAYGDHIRIPQEFTFIGKTMVTLQGLLEKLAPELNPIAVAEPIAKKLILQSFSFKNTKKQLTKSLFDYRRLMIELPTVVRSLMGKAENGSLELHLSLKDGDKLQHRIERLFNRISFSVILLSISIIIAGILISSGLSANTGEEMYALNLIALKAGLVLAVVIILGLLISMFRSRR